MDSSTFLAKVKSLKRDRKFLKAVKTIDDILDDLAPTHKQIWVELLIEKGDLLLILGNTEEAEKTAQLALHLAKMPPHDMKGQGWALNILGRVRLWLFHYDKKSIDYFKQAIVFFSEINDQIGIGVSESYLGLLYYFRGNLINAEQYSKQGLQKNVEFGSDDDIAASKIILGIFNMIAGDLQQAESLFQEGVILSEKSGNTSNLAWALFDLGLTLFWRGKSGTVSTIQKSIAIMEKYETNITSRLIVARYILVYVLNAHKNLKDAQSEVEKFGVMAEKSQLPLAKGYYHLSHGMVKLLKHELGSALELGQRAKEALTLVHYHSGQIHVIKFILQVHLQLYLSTKEEGTKAAIQGLLKELEDLTEREGHKYAYIEALMIRGLLRKSEFDLPGANEQFELAETLAMKCGHQLLARSARTEANQLQEQYSILQRDMKAFPAKFEQMRIQELISYIEGAKQSLKDSD
ncbi:MAG: tetratricopeptide repeat protein [Candidatus Hodarchaeales archaeon]